MQVKYFCTKSIQNLLKKPVVNLKMGTARTAHRRKIMTSAQTTIGVVFWFRNDLRLHDNPALQQAIALAERHQTWLLPVYVHDTALQLTSPWGFVRTSARHHTPAGLACAHITRFADNAPSAPQHPCPIERPPLGIPLGAA